LPEAPFRDDRRGGLSVRASAEGTIARNAIARDRSLLPSLVLLIAFAGLLPLLAGFARLRRSGASASPWPRPGAVLLCTLAFNLTFFWQELWLVIPKALTPGLSPILYHNDHDWTGSSPVAPLLQGTGALATLCSGLGSLALLRGWRNGSTGARLFLWWLAFQGLFQSLTQFAIGSLLPGNDVGRALAWLGAGAAAKIAVCGASVVAMAGAGIGLASRAPAGTDGTRASALALLATAAGCVVLSVPFREPRDLVEVAMIPAIVNLVGIGWVVFGATLARGPAAGRDAPGVAWPLLGLVMLLAVFQLVLRPGIRF
jgi:hypothetical protein